MSWQRIFEVARERKLPIIVTDLAGQEPMVVMPLEEYERFGFDRKSVSVTAIPAEKPTVIPIENQPEIQVPLSSSSVKQNVTGVGELDGALSLEEQFYLEPMDEESNI